MLHLIKKDLYLSRRTIPFILAWFVFITVRSLVDPGYSGPTNLLPLIPMALGFALAVNAIAMDEKFKMDDLFCSLPLKRSTIVAARYLSCFIIIAAGILLSLLACQLFPKPILNLKYSFFAFIFFGLFFSLVLPVNYRFGFQMQSELGKIAAVVGIIGFVVAFVIILSDSKVLSEAVYIIPLGLVLTAAVFISLQVSVYFYNRREF